MAYVAPEPDDLRARFHSFVGTSDVAIEGALLEAGAKVGEMWSDADRRLATLLYAAHLLTLDGFGCGAESEAAAAGASGFKVMRSGSLTLERFDAPTSNLRSTTYGQRFSDLVRINFPAVAVV